MIDLSCLKEYTALYRTALWIAFLLFVLTWGEPDIIGAVVQLLMRSGT
jgi:hypothetical protein